MVRVKGLTKCSMNKERLATHLKKKLDYAIQEMNQFKDNAIRYWLIRRWWLNSVRY